MALKPQGNNIVGGTSLVIDRINSPGYVAGSSGWTINQDGSAEFNNLTIRGTFVGTDFEITSAGIFFYSGTPAAGNPPVAWISTATADPYGNTITPGIFLAELAASGNALAGLLWNTIVGSEPLLALFPDSTVGFAGNSPFVLGRVFNRGAANELLSLALGGGATAGSGSPVQAELFSQSKDGTVKGHVSFYDWASTDLICDINAAGIVAANPGTPNTNEQWHPLSLTTVSGSGNGVNGFRYKKMPFNALLLEWDINTNSVGNAVTIATLPSGWRPATAHNIGSSTYGGAVSLTTAVNPHFTVNTNGTIVTGATGGNAFSMCGTALIGLD